MKYLPYGTGLVKRQRHVRIHQKCHYWNEEQNCILLHQNKLQSTSIRHEKNHSKSLRMEIVIFRISTHSRNIIIPLKPHIHCNQRHKISLPITIHQKHLNISSHQQGKEVKKKFISRRLSEIHNGEHTVSSEIQIKLLFGSIQIRVFEICSRTYSLNTRSQILDCEDLDDENSCQEPMLVLRLTQKLGICAA